VDEAAAPELGPMPPYARAPVWLSYAAFVLVGVSAGVSSVLPPAQMASYGVDRATIGLTFFTGSAGFALAGISTGALIGRYGVRTALAAGGGSYLLAGLYLATRPPFPAFVLVQLVIGYGTGTSRSARSCWLSTSAWNLAWATGASATWCRPALCRTRWPATRSAGTGSG
jgi:fucose permease